MNILMVDDDKYILEGLRNGVNWSRLPFEERYEAKNVAEAKKILSEIRIDVLLCDIDMPKETGLDLLEWLRGQSMPTQVIFLTSYADFNYAQRALQLGSFNYFLKPIEYEKLTDILLEACGKVEELEQQETYQRYGQYWMESEHSRKEAFWNRLIHLETPNADAIAALLANHSMNYTSADNFVLLALRPRADASFNWRDDPMRRYRLCQVLDAPELLADIPLIHRECLMQENNSLWYLIYTVSGDSDSYWKQISHVASNLRKQLKKSFRELAVFISQNAQLSQITAQLQEINLMMFNNISYGNGIFFVVDYHPGADTYVELDREQINLWLLDHDKDALLRYIAQNVQTIAATNTQPYLASRTLIESWTQLIYLFLDKNKVSANMLFASEQYKDLYKNTLHSFSDCEIYLRTMVSEALDYVQRIRQSQDLITQIEDYIQSHLGENLTRSSLGEIFCLNADYLANTFKSTTGSSLIKYINEMRLKRAYDLLRTTDEPIYVISASVGYPNSSYFSKQFRKEYGIGPSDLRT